jgi:hypothetical protein
MHQPALGPSNSSFFRPCGQASSHADKAARKTRQDERLRKARACQTRPPLGLKKPGLVAVFFNAEES